MEEKSTIQRKRLSCCFFTAFGKRSDKFYFVSYLYYYYEYFSWANVAFTNIHTHIHTKEKRIESTIITTMFENVEKKIEIYFLIRYIK